MGDCGGRVVKGLGDGILATFDAPARGLRCADALRAALAAAGIPIRAGVHTGEVELRGEDVSGIGVHIAARVAALAGAGELLASRTVKDLVTGSGYSFDSRGLHSLQGDPGAVGAARRQVRRGICAPQSPVAEKCSGSIGPRTPPTSSRARYPASTAIS